MITETEVVNLIQGLTVRRLRIWVKQGWIRPEQKYQGPVFTEIDIARLHLIRQLKKDMAVNDAAIPIVLSLIDQVHGLRYELKSLAQAVEDQHESVQQDILGSQSTKRGK